MSNSHPIDDDDPSGKNKAWMTTAQQRSVSFLPMPMPFPQQITSQAAAQVGGKPPAIASGRGAGAVVGDGNGNFHFQHKYAWVAALIVVAFVVLDAVVHDGGVFTMVCGGGGGAVFASACFRQASPSPRAVALGEFTSTMAGREDEEVSEANATLVGDDAGRAEDEGGGGDKGDPGGEQDEVLLRIDLTKNAAGTGDSDAAALVPESGDPGAPVSAGSGGAPSGGGSDRTNATDAEPSPSVQATETKTAEAAHVQWLKQRLANVKAKLVRAGLMRKKGGSLSSTAMDDSGNLDVADDKTATAAATAEEPDQATQTGAARADHGDKLDIFWSAATAEQNFDYLPPHLPPRCVELARAAAASVRAEKDGRKKAKKTTGRRSLAEATRDAYDAPADVAGGVSEGEAGNGGITGGGGRRAGHEGSRRRVLSIPEGVRMPPKGAKIFTPSGFVAPDITKPEERAELIDFVKTLKASLGKKPPTCCLDTGDDVTRGTEGAAMGIKKDGCVQCTSPRQPPGAWGTCAVVGLAESILDYKFGSEIDSHDTVIRIGYAPTSEYAAWVGTRTDVVLARMNSKNRDCSLDKDVWRNHGEAMAAKKDLKAYILFADHGKSMFPVPASLQATQHGCKIGKNKEFDGVPITWIHALTRGTMKYRDGLYSHVTKKYAQAYDKEAKEKGFKPTSGFYLVWGIIGSQLCSAVDIYGFGSSGYDTHYFAHTMTANGSHVPKKIVLKPGEPFANQWMKPQHVMGAEDYVFEMSMANSMMCVRNPKNAMMGADERGR